MSHGFLSKETNSYHKTFDFHKNSLQNRNNPNDMLPCDYPSCVIIPSTTRYSKLYGVGYTEYIIFAILSRSYREEYICHPE